MSFNYYPEADRFMKNLHKLNKLWFENRVNLSDEDYKSIFQIESQISDQLSKLELVLRGGEVNEN